MNGATTERKFLSDLIFLPNSWRRHPVYGYMRRCGTLLVKITSDGVQGVAFGSHTGTMKDQALELWPVIRAELTRLDKRVRQASAKLEANRG